MAQQRHRIDGKDAWFIERERYYAFIAEHEVILIPRNNLPIQVKRFTDAVKVTTISPEYLSKTEPYRDMKESVWEGYLKKLGYFKENYIKD